MRSFAFLLILSLGTTISSLARAQKLRSCVLSFERQHHPFSKSLSEIFADNPNVKLKLEAVPQDITHCLELGVEEILILAHAFDIRDQNNNSTIKLGYFVEAKEESRRQIVEKAQSQINELRQIEEAQIRKLQCPPDSLRGPIRREPHQRLCQKAENRLKHYSNLEKTLSNPLEPIYEKNTSLTKFLKMH